MRHLHLPVTDSTSTRAAAMLRDAPETPVLVVAREQRAGRGRHGRAWHSPPGGAWFTLGWPTTMTAATAPLVVGLAVRDAIAPLLDHATTGALSIKWPNDVLLHERKLAGILCEQHVQPGASPGALLVGVGINANNAPETLGDDLRQPPTSLGAVLGRQVDCAALIETCAERIAAALTALERDGLTAEDVRRLNDLLAWRGRRVSLERGGERIEGVLRGIDAGGRALVGERACDAGEVTQLTACPDRPRPSAPFALAPLLRRLGR